MQQIPRTSRVILKAAEVLLLYTATHILSDMDFPWNIPAFFLTLIGGLTLIVGLEMYMNI